MHVGIDLGTTNSTLATFDGTLLSVVPNGLGENLTPSIVRIDARGGLSVGRRAARFLESDPGNTRSEFKRLMGTGERIRFEASGRELLPEELSAQVLSSLLADAKDALGFTPRAAVVSTPALFELPQNHATVKAGELAGLTEVQLIQEPVASAIAAGWQADSAGMWLVYDLGGGTLDVSLLETREGWLRVVDHGGDNFLGGRDFDNVLADWAAARLAAERGLTDLRRDNRQARRAFAKLKAAAEQAKIDLSRTERTSLTVAELCNDSHGEPVDVDLEVDRARLEGLIEPLVERSLGVCRDLLARARVSPEAIERVVFVGGPTLIPLVRARVGDLFGGRIAGGLDPMTLVARGAALFAATAGLDARPRTPETAPPPGLALRVEHPAVTADLEPFVVGRFLPAADEALPRTVRAERIDGAFTSSEIDVPADGSFLLQVRLERNRPNRFHLVATAPSGAPVRLATPDFILVHGISIADPPLSRSIGVALADGTVERYFEKGTPLPARGTVIHKTVRALAPKSTDDLLRIPLVQGESPRAHRNRWIGTLHVPAAHLRRALPSGSRLEVTLHLDRSGQLKARADLTELGQTFEDVIHVLVPTASLDVLRREIETAEGRVADLRRRAWNAREQPLIRNLSGVDQRLAEAREVLSAASGGDTDAAQKLTRLLLDLGSELDDAEDALLWPEVQDDVDGKVPALLSWIGAWGSEAEQRLAEQATAGIAEGRRQRDARAVERHLQVLRSLAGAAYGRDPEAPFNDFGWYETRVAEATDVRLAHDLLKRGRTARDRRDTAGLKVVNRQLSELFPSAGTSPLETFGSGIQ